MSDSAVWRDALLFQAETASTSLTRSSRVTHWCETMKHERMLQTECRYERIKTLLPYTIVGVG